MAPAPANAERIEQALKLAKSDPDQAESIFKDVLSKGAGPSDAAVREYETALMGLGELYRTHKRTDDLAQLVETTRSTLSSFAKAKTAKLVRQLLDLFTSIPHTLETQISVTKSCIAWAVSERRGFLRQNLETRLVSLYMSKASYYDALTLINSLLKELKRLDDKLVLVEVQLLESRVYHALGNVAKARAALTSARTSAASVYTPPLLQAGLDMQSGMLHAEDRDFTTAQSYFIEALEGYAAQDDAALATAALQYMLLCKIMLNDAPGGGSGRGTGGGGGGSSGREGGSVAIGTGAGASTAAADESAGLGGVLSGKTAARYASSARMDAMKAVARAHAHRSLDEYERALAAHRATLGADRFIASHLRRLYDALLEQNLIKVIEPFSRVEIAHVARMVGLDEAQVERKLSQMILDRVIVGVLDQGTACLIVFEEGERDRGYDAALDTIEKLNNVVDVLYSNQASLLE